MGRWKALALSALALAALQVERAAARPLDEETDCTDPAAAAMSPEGGTACVRGGPPLECNGFAVPEAGRHYRCVERAETGATVPPSAQPPESSSDFAPQDR